MSALIQPTHSMPQTYFRSKLYALSSSTNPIIAAAGPLFSLLERLCTSTMVPPIDAMHDNITHELNAFHSRLSAQKYGEEFTFIATFLLSATVDELLGKNYLRLYGKPAEFKAFTKASHDQEGPEVQFFKVIDYLKQRTNQYLDLIELAYYCLITGFEGALHQQVDGRHTLDNLIDNLYRIIQQQRANKIHQLFKAPPPVAVKMVQRKTLYGLSVLALSLTVACYCTSHMLLNQKAKTLLWEHTMLTQGDHIQNG